jgi:hypothetical protein
MSSKYEMLTDYHHTQIHCIEEHVAYLCNSLIIKLTFILLEMYICYTNSHVPFFQLHIQTVPEQPI